jgi:DNA-directed RNA polymerase subunit RPC12/RpoP
MVHPTWALVAVDVGYVCGTCGKEFAKEYNLTDPAFAEHAKVVVVAVCDCGGMVGICRVGYSTTGDTPVPGASNIHSQEDVAAAAALGITLGGNNESDTDDNIH